MQVVGFEALACSIRRDPKRPIDKKLSCFPEGNPNGVIPDKQPVEKGGPFPGNSRCNPALIVAFSAELVPGSRP